jgi:hypothetical protein
MKKIPLATALEQALNILAHVDRSTVADYNGVFLSLLANEVARLQASQDREIAAREAAAVHARENPSLF